MLRNLLSITGGDMNSEVVIHTLDTQWVCAKVFFFFFFFCLFVFRDRLSLCSPGCPGLTL
jgi:hypothetical protein